MKAETIEIKNNTNKNIVVTIQEEPDLHETFKAVEKAIKIFTEILEKTFQTLAEFLNRPEVAKALEALAKESVKEKTLSEEMSNAFEEFLVSGTPYSSFTIFEAGYRAGMKRGDK
jgi:hypothetical protein